MTILCGQIHPNEARFGFDTHYIDLGTGALSVGSKALLLPHISGVMATSGSLAIFAGIATALLAERGDFEHIVETIGQVPEWLKLAQAQAPGPIDSRFEGVTIGWSEKRKRMLGFAFGNHPERGWTAPHEIPRDYIMPGHDGRHQLPNNATAEDLHACAKEQHRLMRKEAPCYAAPGTEFIVAGLRRGHLSTTNMGSLDKPEISLRQGGMLTAHA